MTFAIPLGCFFGRKGTGQELRQTLGKISLKSFIGEVRYMTNIEKEIKYRIPRAGLAEDIASDPLLLKTAFPPGWKTMAVTAYYYDTPGLDFLKAGIAYRVRREGTQWVATVKKGGDSQSYLQQRQEWNIQVSSLLADIALFYGTEIGSELRRISGSKKFITLFSCFFERRYLMLCLEKDTRAELVIDTGEIIAGGKAEPICQLELELKQGDLEVMVADGEKIAGKYGLVPEPRSKFTQGMALAGIGQL